MKLDLIKVKVAQANECLSVNDLAKKTGLSSTTISRILNGVVNPSIKSVGLIAKALNVNVADLIAK